MKSNGRPQLSCVFQFLSEAARRVHHIDVETMKFSHIGIPTKDRFEGEIDLPHLRMTVSDHEDNPFGIAEWILLPSQDQYRHWLART